MDHVVIVFVTRVLVHLFGGIDLRPGNQRSPRPGPSFRIFDRKFIVERGSVNARKAFGDAVGLRIGVLEYHAVVMPEISGLYHQRSALPMAARVAQPLTEILSKMRASVQRDDASAVDHLGSNDHESWAL